MKYFWPLGMTSYYADFPGEFEEEGWERRLFKFIDDMERKHQTWYEAFMHFLCILA